MNLAQNIKKSIYPLLKSAGKWIGMNGKMKLNTKNIEPLTPIYGLVAHSNQGESIDFDKFKGQYLLLSNTASHCGYTAQYSELQALQDKFAGKLNVVAFPANDFGGQEPGSNDEIANFCAVNFGVKFPLMMKSEVIGTGKNAIFQWLSDPAKNGWNQKEPTWNFCKYLVSPEGVLLGFFESGVGPLDETITGLIV